MQYNKMNNRNKNGSSWELVGNWHWNVAATAIRSTHGSIPTNAMHETVCYPAKSIAATLSPPMPFVPTNPWSTAITITPTTVPFVYDRNSNMSTSTAMVIPSNNGGIVHPFSGIVSSWLLRSNVAGTNNNTATLFNKNNTAIPKPFICSSSLSDFFSPAADSIPSLLAATTEGAMGSSCDSYNKPGTCCVLGEEIKEQEMGADSIEEQEILVEDVQEESKSDKDCERDIIEHRKLDHELSNDCTNSETQGPKMKKAKKEVYQETAVDSQWNDMFELLLEYKAQHGNTLVPRRYDKNPQLGKWVDIQRWRYSKTQLSSTRILRLESIGFVFAVNENNWMHMYRQLCFYKEKEGSTTVPHKYTKNPALAPWVCHQRHHCKNKERVKLLEDIDFVWGPRK